MEKQNHLDIDSLMEYLLNKVTPEEETIIQEHLSDCSDCRKKLQDLRTLKTLFNSKESKISFAHRVLLITRNTWVRVAVSIIIIGGVGVGLYHSSRPEGFPINDPIVPETVLSVDTFPVQDSTSIDSTSVTTSQPEIFKED